MAYQVTTPADLIRLALLGINAIGQNEPVSADEAQDALFLLNDMIDDWNTHKQFIYTIQRQAFTISTIKQLYTYGPGGDFNAPRPSRIEECYVQLNNGISSSELPVDILSYDEWANITVKPTASPIARSMWPDYQYPLINCSFWPVPNATQTFVFYVWQQLGMLTNLTTPLAFPPGYRRALRYNLQVELCSLYDKDPSEAMLLLASDSRGNIKRLNKIPLYMKCDDALAARGRVFNYLTGETT